VLLPPALRTGKFTIECTCPDAFRALNVFWFEKMIAAVRKRFVKVEKKKE